MFLCVLDFQKERFEFEIIAVISLRRNKIWNATKRLSSNSYWKLAGKIQAFLIIPKIQNLKE